MGIQTSGGGIFNSKGIESEQVKVFSQTSQARNLDNFKNIDSECQIYHDERVLSKQCDYFIPAGHELSINSVMCCIILLAHGQVFELQGHGGGCQRAGVVRG